MGIEIEFGFISVFLLLVGQDLRIDLLLDHNLVLAPHFLLRLHRLPLVFVLVREVRVVPIRVILRELLELQQILLQIRSHLLHLGLLGLIQVEDAEAEALGHGPVVLQVKVAVLVLAGVGSAEGDLQGETIDNVELFPEGDLSKGKEVPWRLPRGLSG